MPEPKNTVKTKRYKGFTNSQCEFYPCHTGVKREFNCMFCYCPLIAYECPGPYLVYTDWHGLKRKDCTHCTLPHDGYQQAWAFIQKWLEAPVVWRGNAQDTKYLRKIK